MHRRVWAGTFFRSHQTRPAIQIETNTLVNLDPTFLTDCVLVERLLGICNARNARRGLKLVKGGGGNVSLDVVVGVGVGVVESVGSVESASGVGVVVGAGFNGI